MSNPQIRFYATIYGFNNHLWFRIVPAIILRVRGEENGTRSRDAVVQLKARMREPLRARLEAAAKRRGVSLNAELVDRLDRSFAKDDAFGGLVIANAARLMAAAFLQGGQHEERMHTTPIGGQPTG